MQLFVILPNQYYNFFWYIKMYKIGHDNKKITIKLKNDRPDLDPSKDKYMCDETVQKSYDPNLR